MQNRPPAQVKAIQQDRREGQLKQWLLGSVVGVAAVWPAGELLAEAHEVAIESHGFNEYSALKYPADYPHLDYVNPDAPLGGEISVSRTGTFDSLNPYATLSGTPAALSSTIWETLLSPTSDEVESFYCLLCTTL